MSHRDDHTLPAGGMASDPPEPIEVVPARFLGDYVPRPEPRAAGSRIRELLQLLQKHRLLAGVAFAVTFGLAGVAVFLSPREYTAVTILQLSRNSPIQLQLKDNVLNLEEGDRTFNGASSFISTQVGVLKSRDLAERAIRAQHLVDNPAFVEPGTRNGGMLSSVAHRLPEFLRPRGVSTSDAETPPPAAEPAATSAEVPPDLLDQYMGYLEVRDVRPTDLVEVRFTTPDPVLSATLAAAHTQAYLDAAQNAQVVTDETAMGFLETQLARSRERVEGAERALNEFATEHPNVAVNQEHELIASQIAELSTQVTQAQAERTKTESRFQFLSQAKDEPLAYLFEDSPAIEKLRLALLEVEGQRAALAGRLGPKHAQMLDLGEQASELGKQLRIEIGREIAAAGARYQAAKRHEQDLRGVLGKLEDHAISLQHLGGQYKLLKGETENARLLHESLLKQKSETAVHSQLATATTRVVQRAEVPDSPSRPSRRLGLLLGLLSGVAVAGLAVMLRESLDRSIRSSAEVEELLHLPTLAVIPNFALARKAEGRAAVGIRATILNRSAQDLVVLREPRSPVAETFRRLRTAVLFAQPDNPPKVILVASAGAGEGKTVTALNLATTLADSGLKVLLLDVDLRAPGCHQVLGVDNARGLSTYLTGKGDLDGFVKAVGKPHISFVPAGPTPPNPADLVGSERMRAALRKARDTYDFVILDSPPVLPVTDAVVLAREVDGVVLVVKGGSSLRELVVRARDQLRLAGASVMGVVVNNVDLRWGGLEYYSYYGYGRASSGTSVEGRAA